MLSTTLKENDIDIISDQLRSDVFKAIHEIRTVVAEKRAQEDSLLTGNLGLVIYHAYLYKIFNDDNHLNSALDIIEEVFDKVKISESSLKTFQFSIGFAGLGTTIQILIDQNLLDFDIDQEFEIIDEFIFETTLRKIDEGYVEFLHGAAGVLHYFNFRRKSEKIDNYKSKLVSAIISKIKASDNLGIRVPRSQFAWTDSIDHDLSLSHGLCGVMLILLSVLKRDDSVDSELISNYLSHAYRFILRLERRTIGSNGKINFFPSYSEIGSSFEQIDQSKSWESARLAWCYGDLNWVIFLYKYADATNMPHLKQLADAIGTYTTSRMSIEETHSQTAHFCHGHAGLALIYLKLYEFSKREEYRTAYQYWLKETIKQLHVELQSGHYKEKSLETSFLEGLPGIALVLASFVSNDADFAGWQRLLLL